MANSGTRKSARRPKGAGNARQLPSGRWQARFHGPDGRTYTGQQTFDTRMDAQAWLAEQKRSVESQTWEPPRQAATGSMTLQVYADAWLQHHPRLRPRTRDLYRRTLDRQILPELGHLTLKSISPTTVRNWHASLNPDKPRQRSTAYGLLNVIMNTAVREELITASPCRIQGGGSHSRRHNVVPATVEQIEVMAQAMPDRYRAMLHLAAWCQLRSGEVRALRRKDIDLDAAQVSVRRAVVWNDGRFIEDKPKTKAGIRDISIPPHIVPIVAQHLSDHVGASPESLLFPAARNSDIHLGVGSLNRIWYPARAAAGRPDMRWYDLRHTGATAAAVAGATIAELMARMGHTTASAAMVYQHATQDRDRALAARMSAIAVGKP